MIQQYLMITVPSVVILLLLLCSLGLSISFLHLIFILFLNFVFIREIVRYLLGMKMSDRGIVISQDNDPSDIRTVRVITYLIVLSIMDIKAILYPFLTN